MDRDFGSWVKRHGLVKPDIERAKCRLEGGLRRVSIDSTVEDSKQTNKTEQTV